MNYKKLSRKHKISDSSYLNTNKFCKELQEWVRLKKPSYDVIEDTMIDCGYERVDDDTFTAGKDTFFEFWIMQDGGGDWGIQIKVTNGKVVNATIEDGMFVSQPFLQPSELVADSRNHNIR